MFMQVFEDWRYIPGGRARALERFAELRTQGEGVMPLRPDVPGLLARVIGTDPADPDTGVAFWVWETREAERAFDANRPPEMQGQLYWMPLR
jgi:hypothetical protein